jgi:hypothetical protein
VERAVVGREQRSRGLAKRCLKIDLAATRWLMLNPGSPQSAVTNTSPYYLDGLPVSRHTYYDAIHFGRPCP